MQLARLLHSKGFHIIFVNTEYNNKRLIRTRGIEAVKGLSDFQFHTIHDGLPPFDKDATQYHPPTICYATQHNCLEPFMDLLNKLSSQIPHVSFIVSDGAMTFAIKAAQLLGITHASFWTASACSHMGYLQFSQLLCRAISPLKGLANLTDGTLERNLEWIPGMSNIRLRDLPSFATTMDTEDVMFKFLDTKSNNCMKSSAIIFSTFDALEEQMLLVAIKMEYTSPQIYTISNCEAGVLQWARAQGPSGAHSHETQFNFM
ncbi:7-deoxyloganetin glucosyltransferase [Linum perenne]